MFKPIEKEGYRGSTEIIIHRSKILQPVAEFAAHLVERWGMVAGQPDGEDSAGRAKIRLATPQEMVARAFSAAELVFAEAEKRGLVLDVPDPKPPRPMSQEDQQQKSRERLDDIVRRAGGKPVNGP